MSRKSKRIGDFAEAAVLADQQARCQQRGWGFAVPLSPNYPADVLAVTPLGPTFIEVKATMHPTRSVHRLSAPEARLAAECQAFGARYVLATVRIGKVGGATPGTAWAVTSLSYSPVPAVGPRRGPRVMRKAPHYLRAETRDQVRPQSWLLGTTYGPAPKALLPRDGWTTALDIGHGWSAASHSGDTSPKDGRTEGARPS
jgi:hypothetical protein